MSEYVLASDKTPEDGQFIDIWSIFGNRFIDCMFVAETIGVQAHVLMRDEDVVGCDVITFDYVHCWRPAEEMPLRPSSNTSGDN